MPLTRLYPFQALIKAACLAVSVFILSSCGGPAPDQRPIVKKESRQQSPENEAGKKTDEAEKTTPSTALPDPFDDSSKIHVAVLLPLSGANQGMGKALLKAVTLALFDSYDPRIKLYPFDTQGTPKGATAAAEAALAVNARIVIGPLLADSVKSAGAVLTPKGVPLIGLSNDRTAASRGQYLLGFLPETEVRRIVSYSFLKGNKRMAALIPDSNYGYRVLDSFADSLDQLGGTVSGIQTYPLNPDVLQNSVKKIANYDARYRAFKNEIRYLRSLNRDMSDELADKLERAEEIEDPDFDSIILPEGGDLLRTMAPLLPYYEVDPKKIRFLGTGLMEDQSLYNEPPLQGSWFAGVPQEQLKPFIDHFEATYGVTPPRLASLAYDAMGLVATIIRDQLADRSKDAANLSKIPETEDPFFTLERLEDKKGFMGINGLFRFLPDGTNERALAILEIDHKSPKVIDPAPKEFPSFGYMVKQVAEQQKAEKDQNPSE